jgi:hypothetical protein
MSDAAVLLRTARVREALYASVAYLWRSALLGGALLLLSDVIACMPRVVVRLMSLRALSSV